MKALLLSDIHFKGKEYSSESNLKNVSAHCAQFKAALSAKDFPKDLDYLILMGDIAFAGEKKDYDLFEALVLDEIRKVYPSITILSVPGNHDICWKEADFLIKSLGGSRTTAEERSQLLQDSFPLFERPFRNYTKFLEKNDINKNFANPLFGWHIDKTHKVVFLLINSSWFSIGSGFDNLIIKYCKQKSITNLKTILSIKDKIAEFGNQMIANDQIEALQLEDNIFDKYPDFTYITLMHHPLHWLNWSEVYGTKLSEQSNKKLYTILHHSSFLITGHEHIPFHVTPGMVFNQVHHIAAGCFLEECSDWKKFNQISHNRFSVIELYKNYEFLLKERKFSFDYEGDRTRATLTAQKKFSVKEVKSEEIKFNPKINYNIEYISKIDFDDDLRKSLIANLIGDDQFFESTSSNTDFFTVINKHKTHTHFFYFFKNQLVYDNQNRLTLGVNFSDIDQIILNQRNGSKHKILIHYVIFDHLDSVYLEEVSRILDAEIELGIDSSYKVNMIKQHLESLKNKINIAFNNFKYEYFQMHEKGDIISTDELLNTGLAVHLIPFQDKINLK